MSPRFLGAANTVIRTHDGFIEWMTANDAACEALVALLKIYERGDYQELVVTLEQLDAATMATLTNKGPDLDGFQRYVGDAGRIQEVRFDPEGALVLHVSTPQPNEAWARLARAFPEELLNEHVTAAVRPATNQPIHLVAPRPKEPLSAPLTCLHTRAH
jgi:hypothetical protein